MQEVHWFWLCTAIFFLKSVLERHGDVRKAEPQAHPHVARSWQPPWREIPEQSRPPELLQTPLRAGAVSLLGSHWANIACVVTYPPPPKPQPPPPTPHPALMWIRDLSQEAEHVMFAVFNARVLIARVQYIPDWAESYNPGNMYHYVESYSSHSQGLGLPPPLPLAMCTYWTILEQHPRNHESTPADAPQGRGQGGGEGSSGKVYVHSSNKVCEK